MGACEQYSMSATQNPQMMVIEEGAYSSCSSQEDEHNTKPNVYESERLRSISQIKERLTIPTESKESVLSFAIADNNTDSLAYVSKLSEVPTVK